MSVNFYDAINLFQLSVTGQGGTVIAGAQGHPELASDVIAKLWELFNEQEIGFVQLPPTVGGDSTQNGRLGEYDIRINRKYRNDLGTTSCLIVHEAVHMVRPWGYIDEELRCRYLALSYYEELRQGRPQPLSIRADRGRQNSQPITIRPAEDIRRLESQRKYCAQKQLVDYVLSMPEYSNSLTADWIRRHIRDWEGIRNRWGATKGLYIRTLAEEGSDENADLVLEIMESVNRNDQLTELLRTAGSLENIPNLFQRRLFDTQFWNRVRSVQDSWQTLGHRIYLGAGSR